MYDQATHIQYYLIILDKRNQLIVIHHHTESKVNPSRHLKLSRLGTHPCQLNSVVNILNDKYDHQLPNLFSEKQENHQNEISSDLLQNQVRNALFEPDHSWVEPVAILTSQVLTQLIEPPFLLILPLFQHF